MIVKSLSNILSLLQNLLKVLIVNWLNSFPINQMDSVCIDPFLERKEGANERKDTSFLEGGGRDQFLEFYGVAN